MRWRIKKLSTGGKPGGIIQVASWKCNFGIYLDIQIYYLDIQAINTLLCLLLVLYVFVPSIYSIFLTYLSPEKWRFPALKSLLLPQFSTYRHQTGFIVKREQVHITNYLALPINWYLKKKSCLFCKKMSFSKNSQKFIIHLFFKKR